MNIETKFEVDQDVFLLFKDAIHEVEIREIRINVSRGLAFNVDILDIRYQIKKNPVNKTYTTWFSEDELHATKQLLLESL